MSTENTSQLMVFNIVPGIQCKFSYGILKKFAVYVSMRDFFSFLYKQSKYQQLVPVLLSCTWGLRSDAAKLWSAPYNFTMTTTLKQQSVQSYALMIHTSVGNNMETNNSNTPEEKKLDTSKNRNHVNRTKYISSRNEHYIHSYPKLWAINWEFSFGICGGKKE